MIRPLSRRTTSRTVRQRGSGVQRRMVRVITRPFGRTVRTRRTVQAASSTREEASSWGV
jgi:hypothetical protein